MSNITTPIHPKSSDGTELRSGVVESANISHNNINNITTNLENVDFGNADLNDTFRALNEKDQIELMGIHDTSVRQNTIRLMSNAALTTFHKKIGKKTMKVLDSSHVADRYRQLEFLYSEKHGELIKPVILTEPVINTALTPAIIPTNDGDDDIDELGEERREAVEEEVGGWCPGTAHKVEGTGFLAVGENGNNGEVIRPVDVGEVFADEEGVADDERA